MNDMESLLHHALAPTAGDEPDSHINHKILQAYKEEIPMKQKLIKKPALAILAATAIIASGSFTAVAAWHYLNPAQVAKDAGDKKLSRAFQSDNALSINESQTIGDYKITLKGVVSGKDLSSLPYSSDGKLVDDRTYAVLSIEKKDGTPLASSGNVSDVSDKEHFVVSPFLQGCDINRINMYTLQAGVTTSLKDGIMYKLIDCDNLETFADREVYMAVMKTDGSDTIDCSAYETDKKTGHISRAKNYSGINALFTLPLDKNKADREKADEFIKKWTEPEDISDTEDEGMDVPRHSQKPEWSVKKIKKEGIYLKKYTKTAKPDKDGAIPFPWKDQGFESDSVIWIDDLKDLKKGNTEILMSCGSDDRRYFVLGTRETGDNYTLRLYRVNY